VVNAAQRAVPTRVQRAWDVSAGVLDSKVPALSLCELGIVRAVREGHCFDCREPFEHFKPI
jgi:ring-1,2-phenylacetyl-CoA epoxidase subunit PaaD